MNSNQIPYFNLNPNNNQNVSNPVSPLLKKLQNSSKKEMSDDEKQRIEQQIQGKLKHGKKLTSKELSYLRQYNPQLYTKAKRIMNMAEAFEHRLEAAHSKEEVNNIITSTISGIPDNDPDKEYLVAAFMEVEKDFKKSDAYQKLPAKNVTESKSKVHKNTSVKSVNSTHSDYTDLFINTDYSNDSYLSDNENLLNWSPLQEIIDSMPSLEIKG